MAGSYIFASNLCMSDFSNFICNHPMETQLQKNLPQPTRYQNIQKGWPEKKVEIPSTTLLTQTDVTNIE
jgi:hypothetical protein